MEVGKRQYRMGKVRPGHRAVGEMVKKAPVNEFV